MARYLVVAHETVTNPELLNQLRAIQKDDQQAEFVLLVPATPVRHLLRRGDEHDAEVVAGKRADRARSMFARKGVHLAGTRVGAASPADAVDDELRDNPGYAGVVISTLPKEKSRWLRMDLPRTVESRHRPAGVPRAGAARVVGRRLALTAVSRAGRGVATAAALQRLAQAGPALAIVYASVRVLRLPDRWLDEDTSLIRRRTELAAYLLINKAAALCRH